eukprot:10774624-Alexandrium_andersonii.AAC.1
MMPLPHSLGLARFIPSVSGAQATFARTSAHCRPSSAHHKTPAHREDPVLGWPADLARVTPLS